MFTMDDWLGLVILMVCIVSVILVIWMFTKGCIGVARWAILRRKAMLPTLADMGIGYHPGPPIVGIDMGAGDDITTHKFSVPLSLDSIIRDLRETIVLEHLEVRSTTRFNNILKRLEAYRDSHLPVPSQPTRLRDSNGAVRMNGLLTIALGVFLAILFDKFGTRDAFGVSNDTWAGLAASAFAYGVVFGMILMVSNHFNPTT